MLSFETSIFPEFYELIEWKTKLVMVRFSLNAISHGCPIAVS